MSRFASPQPDERYFGEPSWSPLSFPVPLSHSSITASLVIQFPLMSPQESVLFRYYRHERPIVIVRPALKYSIRTMDNSQGKCGRYKAKLCPTVHWSDDVTALSCVMNKPLRRRIAVAPNDNSNGKSSRFKGLAIVRVQTPCAQIIKSAIACIPPFPFPFFNLFRNENTMTPPTSPGIQRPCFLPIDPPCTSKFPPLPSTFIKLPHINILPPPPQLSTLPPSYEMQMLPPSNVTLPLPPYNDPLPLPTMLINISFVPLPPSSSVIPLSHSLPHITRHCMSESIGLEAHHFPPQFECAQSICRQWPSGATVSCLSRVCCDGIVHAACGKLAPE